MDVKAKGQEFGKIWCDGLDPCKPTRRPGTMHLKHSPPRLTPLQAHNKDGLRFTYEKFH